MSPINFDMFSIPATIANGSSDDNHKIVNYSDIYEKVIDDLGIREQVESHKQKVDFMTDSPKLLFVVDYMIKGEFKGSLLVWEKYEKATHYKVFKRNLFSGDSDFKRILVIGRNDLQEETNRFVPYLRYDLGMSDLNDREIYIILDGSVKRDRIYEYKVGASMVPQSASEVDYAFILYRNDKITSIPPDVHLFDSFAINILGNINRKWMISLLNKKIDYFNLLIQLQRKPFSEITNSNVLYTTDQRYLEDMIRETISLFGAKNTFDHILNLLGGIPDMFKQFYLGSINEDDVSFSYYVFQKLFEDRIYNSFAFSTIKSLKENDSSLSDLVGISESLVFLFDAYELYLRIPYNEIPSWIPRSGTFAKTQEAAVDMSKQVSTQNNLNVGGLSMQGPVQNDSDNATEEANVAPTGIITEIE